MIFDALVLKVASRCNLNCSYCFMYNLGDTTYKNQPKFMSDTTVDNILKKVKSYIKKFNKEKFTFLFHGGEPLLASEEFYRLFISKANQLQKDLDKVTFYYEMQTNGVLINDSWLNLFKELNIYPSVSVDGTPKAHDMFRVDHKGKGSYEDVFKGVSLLRNKMGHADIACVINTKENPKETYDSFKKMNVSLVNFLIPDYTHDNFPFDKNKNTMSNWLIELFDIWINDPERYKIPMFIGFINSLLRITENTENESKVLVIETNGEIEAIDSLKACGNGFTKTGLSINNNEFSDIKNSPLGSLYFGSHGSKLCNQCMECPLNEICKGGRLVHRYSKKNGFNNPSVYCKDLITFIAHIQNYFMNTLPELHKEENIEAIDPSEIIEYLNTIPSKSSHSYSKELEAFSNSI